MFLTRNSPEPTRHHPTAKRIEERGNSTLRGFSPQLRVLPEGRECAQRLSPQTVVGDQAQLRFAYLSTSFLVP